MVFLCLCLKFAHFGIDSSEYSFPYLVGWKTDEKRLFESLARIERVADRLIAVLEPPAVEAGARIAA